MRLTVEKIIKIGESLKIDYSKTPFSEFVFGLTTELEHSDIIKKDDYKTLGKIVSAHLKENPRYYFYLKQAGL